VRDERLSGMFGIAVRGAGIGLALWVAALAAMQSAAGVGLDAFEANRRLGRGVNLGNALDAPREGDWGMRLEEGYFGLIKDAGFQSVRIPVRWSAHAAEQAPFRIEMQFMARVEWAVRQAMARKLTCVLNIHHYEAFDADPAAQRERFLALWDQIANRFTSRIRARDGCPGARRGSGRAGPEVRRRGRRSPICWTGPRAGRRAAGVRSSWASTAPTARRTPGPA
jgi:hypothetical protein